MSNGPSALRISGACLAAAAAAAAPTLLLGRWAAIALPVGFVIAGIHVLLFGLPAYLLLRRRMRIDWAQAIIAGIIVGAVPLALWSWLRTGGGFGPSLAVALISGVLGMLGGMTFRAIVGPPVEREDDTQTAGIFE